MHHLAKINHSSRPERNETKAENKDKLFSPLDRETLNGLRKKKICFYCKGPYDMKHDYPLRPKGKENKVMWAYYEDSNFENSDQQSENEESIEEKEDIGYEKIKGRLKEAHLTSVQQEGSFRMRGYWLVNELLLCLIQVLLTILLIPN